MVDLKRLKATADLAKLQHDSFKTEETKAAHDAAVRAYETAVVDQATDGVVDAVVDAIKTGSTAPAKPPVSSKQSKPAPEGSTPKAKPVAEQTDVKKVDAIVDKAAAEAVAADASVPVLNLTADTGTPDRTTAGDGSATTEPDPTAIAGGESGNADAEKKSE